MVSPQPRPPVPSAGLPPGVEAGPLGKRFVAHLIDSLVPGLITGAVLAVVLQANSAMLQLVVPLVGGVLVLVWFLLIWWMLATKAAGPGMRLMKLQLVGLKDGRPIGWGRVFVRALVLAVLEVSVVGTLVILIFMVQHPRKQGAHDLLADSVVIKERPLAPRPVKARSATAQPTQQAARQPASSGGYRPGSGSQPAPSPQPTPLSRPEVPAASHNQAQPADHQEGQYSQQTGPNAQPQQPDPDQEPSQAQEPLSPPAPAIVQPPLAPPSFVGSATTQLPTGAAQEVYDGHPVPGLETRPLDEGWVAVLDDGREVDVSGLVLLGRNPQARPGEDDAELIKIADETRTVSKTHLALSVDANGLYVMDRGSTNGSTVTNPSGISDSCPAGDAVSVADGTIVSFGDHWLEVKRHS